jgi:serine/threonine protein kinase
VIHKDIKAQNIVFTQSGNVKLLDFGLSEKGYEIQMDYGTAGYLAPEVFKTRLVTSKSDVYSVGIIAYLLLMMEMPYTTDFPTANLMELN